MGAYGADVRPRRVEKHILLFFYQAGIAGLLAGSSARRSEWKGLLTMQLHNSAAKWISGGWTSLGVKKTDFFKENQLYFSE